MSDMYPAMSDMHPAISDMYPALAAARPVAGAPRLWHAGVMSVALSVVANAFLYLAGAPFDLFPQSVLIHGANAPITLARVIVVTTICVTTAVLVFAVLRRQAGRPFRAFRVVALGALLLSYTQPSLALDGAPLRMTVALNTLHTVAALLTVWVLGRAAGEGGRRASR